MVKNRMKSTRNHAVSDQSATQNPALGGPPGGQRRRTDTSSHGMAQSPVSGDRVTETGSALVAPRFGVVRPVVVLVVRRVGLVVVVALAAMQLLRQLPEVRLVSAVLQVAGDLRLLGFRSAAPHRVSPLARSAGARNLDGGAPGLLNSSLVGPTLPVARLFPHTEGAIWGTQCDEDEGHQPGCWPVRSTRPPFTSSRRTSPATQARMPCAASTSIAVSMSSGAVRATMPTPQFRVASRSAWG